MKLSEIKGERALEVLVDLIDPVTLIVADEEIVNTYKSKAPKILLVKKLIETHKKEVLTILAILNNENPETYEPSLIELPKMLLDLVHDEELMNLFTSQNQTMESESSGSATENIEAPKRI